MTPIAKNKDPAGNPRDAALRVLRAERSTRPGGSSAAPGRLADSPESHAPTSQGSRTNRTRPASMQVSGRASRGLSLALALGALAWTAGPARADQRDDEIRRLHDELTEQKQAHAELRGEFEALRDTQRDKNSELTRTLEELALSEQRGVGPWTGAPPRGSAPSRGPKLDLGGYFSTQYRSSELPGERSSFVDMRLVPQLHAEISKNISFDTEVEIEHAGVGGGGADGEIIVEYAELSFEFSEEFTLKAGTLLIPMGQFNLNHDDPMNELASRPRVARFIVPSAFDLPGIGAAGSFEASDEAIVNYDIALTNGFRDAFDSEKGSRSARGQFEEDENHDKALFARVAVVPQVDALDALSVGVSGAVGKLGVDGEHDLTGYGFDVQAKLGDWEFMGEYDAFSIDRASGSPPPLDAATGMLGPVRGLSGYYAQFLRRVRFDGLRDLPFADESASMAFVVRYETVDLNDRVRGASPQDDETAWSFGINFRPTARTVVKIEYRIADSPYDGPEGSDRNLFTLEFATYF